MLNYPSWQPSVWQAGGAHESCSLRTGNTHGWGDDIYACPVHPLPTRNWCLLHRLSSLSPTPSLLLITNHGCYLLPSSFPSFSDSLFSLLLFLPYLFWRFLWTFPCGLQSLAASAEGCCTKHLFTWLSAIAWGGLTVPIRGCGQHHADTYFLSLTMAKHITGAQ